MTLTLSPSEPEQPRSPGSKVALVLGGGGLVGQAFHAGALAGLEHDLGWDPRGASVIVGTSAGAVTGTLLRGGVPASDLAAWCTGAPLSPFSVGRIDPLAAFDDFPALNWRTFLRPQLPNPVACARALRSVRSGVLSAALAALPAGEASVLAHLGFVEGLGIGGWPGRDLWICAVRRADGHRVVFGREDAPTVPLLDAVGASCSVPGYFAPVDIDGDEFVDGGVHSPTNADLVAQIEDLDVVIVVSPMSATGPVARSLGGVLRRLCTMSLRRELRAIKATGTAVVVVEPGSDVVGAMRDDFMSRSALRDVAREAFLQTQDCLSAADRLDELLGSRTPIAA